MNAPTPRVKASQYVLSSPRPQAVLRPSRIPLYDTEIMYAGTAISSILFFQKPQGQTTLTGGTAVTKTKVHTNMTNSGQLGVPQEFDLYGFRLRFWQYSATSAGYATSGVDEIVQLARCIGYDGVFSFLFGQKAWFEVPAIYIPSGSGTLSSAPSHQNRSFGALSPFAIW